ncbi:hypothetical protein [Chitinophaga sp.]|uniref:hypothetical protein n=1 Tax=Chitinophaga sp. TaxID=1869181 RepID=UPI0031D54EDD
MKNILVPTDLSIRSLNFLHSLAERQQTPANIILMHALRLPDSIMDFWAFTRTGRQHAVITDNFREACEVMRNRYAQTFLSLEVEFFYGSTSPALRNFLQAHNINEIGLPENYRYELPCENSYNPEPLFRKCKVPAFGLQISQHRRVVTAPSSISELLGAYH